MHHYLAVTCAILLITNLLLGATAVTAALVAIRVPEVTVFAAVAGPASHIVLASARQLRHH